MAPPTTPDKFPALEMFDETFVLKIGKPGTDSTTHSFNVFKGIASFYSEFFAAALNKDTFKEGKSNCVELPEEEDVDVFRNLLGWMYTRRLPNVIVENGEFDDLLQMGILADRYMIPLLENEVLTAIHARAIEIEMYPSGTDVYDIYDGTRDGCGLRRWVCAMHMMNTDSCFTGEPELSKDRLSKDAMWDMFKALEKYGKSWNIYETFVEKCAKLDICSDFHIHGEGEKCGTVEKL